MEAHDDDDLDPAAGHRARWGTCSSTPITPRATSITTRPPSRRRGADLGASIRPAAGTTWSTSPARRSLRDWYDTIGKNGWRLEEFQHYYGNATFDDAGTAECGAVPAAAVRREARSASTSRALDKAIQFVLDSQYPIGGWPQRYPLRHGVLASRPARLHLLHHLQRRRRRREHRFPDHVLSGARRSARPGSDHARHELLPRHAAGPPQPGWGLQYTTGPKPAGARTYEPKALATHTTADQHRALINFYELTGDTKFLARIPEAHRLAGRGLKLPPALRRNGRTHPTFIELGHQPAALRAPPRLQRRERRVLRRRATRRTRSVHYSSTRAVDVPRAAEALRAAQGDAPAEAASETRRCRAAARALPSSSPLQRLEVSDLNVSGEGRAGPMSRGAGRAR